MNFICTTLRQKLVKIMTERHSLNVLLVFRIEMLDVDAFIIDYIWHWKQLKVTGITTDDS